MSILISCLFGDVESADIHEDQSVAVNDLIGGAIWMADSEVLGEVE